MEENKEANIVNSAGEKTEGEGRNNKVLVVGTIIVVIVFIVAGIAFQLFVGNNKVVDDYSDEGDYSPVGDAGEKLGHVNPRYAFVRQGNIWYAYKGLEKQLTTDGSSEPLPYGSKEIPTSYSSPEISSDGDSIAFLRNNNDSVDLLVVNIEENVTDFEPQEVITELNLAVNKLEWSNDDSTVFYATLRGEREYVESVDVVSGEKKSYGSFDLHSGCGGGSSDPADHVAAAEGIISIGSTLQIFALSPDNNYLVHDTGCAGNIGIMDIETGEDRELEISDSDVAIFADSSKFVLSSDKKIFIYDYQGSLVDSYDTSEKPKSLLWDESGEYIYYTTSTVQEKLELDDQVALDILGSSPVSFDKHKSIVWELDLSSRKSTEVVNLGAHYLRLISSADKTLAVASVQDSTDFYSFVSGGGTSEGFAEHYPQVLLLEVNTVDPGWEIKGNDVQQVSLFEI